MVFEAYPGDLAVTPEDYDAPSTPAVGFIETLFHDGVTNTVEFDVTTVVREFFESGSDLGLRMRLVNETIVGDGTWFTAGNGETRLTIATSRQQAGSGGTATD